MIILSTHTVNVAGFQRKHKITDVMETRIRATLLNTVTTFNADAVTASAVADIPIATRIDASPTLL